MVLQLKFFLFSFPLIDLDSGESEISQIDGGKISRIEGGEEETTNGQNEKVNGEIYDHNCHHLQNTHMG
jgi:hypothetical protein